jgi:tetratricopeptide (TPR) repeat protein
LTEFQERKWPQAVNTLTELIRLNPAAIEAYHRRSIAYLALCELDRAIADCSWIIGSGGTPITRAEPVSRFVTDAYLHRGEAFARTGQHEKAIADFTEAIRLEPDVPTAYAWRAQSYRTLGDKDSAAQDKQKAQELGIAAATIDGTRGGD